MAIDTNHRNRSLFQRFRRLVSRAGLAGGGAPNKDSDQRPDAGRSVSHQGHWYDSDITDTSDIGAHSNLLRVPFDITPGGS
jgi:hypothetical protein